MNGVEMTSYVRYVTKAQLEILLKYLATQNGVP